MSSDIIRADYPALEQIADSFEQEFERIRRVHQVVTRQVSILRGGGWTADAAERFYQEMDGDVQPAIGRLADSLKQASAITREIIRVIKAAEEEAAACLNGAGNGNGSGAGAGGVPGTPGGTTFGGGFFEAWANEKGDPQSTIRFDKPFHLMSGAELQAYYGYRNGPMTAEDIENFINKDPFARKPSDYVSYGATFMKDEVSGGAAVWEGNASGDWGSASVRALSAEGSAGYKLSWGKDGLTAKGEFDAGLYLARATYNGEFAGVNVAADAYVGANVQGEASVVFNPLNGDVGVKAGGEVFAGGRAGGEVKTDIGPVGLGAQGSVSYGIGATAKADIGMEDGVFRADVKLGATLGLGLEGGFSVNLDVPKAAETVVDAGRAAADFVTFWD